MNTGSNFLNSGIKVFEILQKFYEKNPKREDLSGDFSDDTLLIYLNTLKKLSVPIKFPTKKKPFYIMEDSFPFLNLSDDDLLILSKIKMLLAKDGSYTDVFQFHELLMKFLNYMNNDTRLKVCKILEEKPFGTDSHSKITEFEKYVKDESILLIEYISPTSGRNFFKVLSKSILLRNAKLLFACYDNSINDTRYLRFERIKSVKVLDEKFNINNVADWAICKFTNFEKIDFSELQNYEILDSTSEILKIKIHFDNIFEFQQFILSCGADCEILEPSEVRSKILKKISLIRGVYAG